eukprot:3941945-Karenia_brevis.AAC.1
MAKQTLQGGSGPLQKVGAKLNHKDSMVKEKSTESQNQKKERGIKAKKRKENIQERKREK